MRKPGRARAYIAGQRKGPVRGLVAGVAAYSATVQDGTRPGFPALLSAAGTPFSLGNFLKYPLNLSGFFARVDRGFCLNWRIAPDHIIAPHGDNGRLGNVSIPPYLDLGKLPVFQVLPMDGQTPVWPIH